MLLFAFLPDVACGTCSPVTAVWVYTFLLSLRGSCRSVCVGGPLCYASHKLAYAWKLFCRARQFLGATGSSEVDVIAL